MEIADKCPVHRTLTSEMRIVTREAGLISDDKPLPRLREEDTGSPLRSG